MKRRLFALGPLALGLFATACAPPAELAGDPGKTGGVFAPSAASNTFPPTTPSIATALATPSAVVSSGTDVAGSPPLAPLAPLPGYVVRLDPVARPCPEVKGSDAELESRIEHGDACAAAARAERLVDHRALPDDYARALSLFSAALDAGVAVSCWPFGVSDDRARYARCTQLGDNRAALALVLAYGDGVPRDLQKARAVAKELGDVSCDASMLTEQLDKAAAAPAGRSPSFCEVAACTTLAMNFCTSEFARIDGFETSTLRGRLVSQLSEPERASYAQATAALDAYRHVESDRVYWMHIGGTMRSLLASGRENVLNHEHDVAAQKIVEHETLPAATDAELAELGRAIASAEAQATKDGVPGIVFDPSNQVDYRKAVTASVGSYARYERSMLDLAKARGADEPRLRAVRAELRRARIEGLKDDL